jgi:phage recombination protein Bet
MNTNLANRSSGDLARRLGLSDSQLEVYRRTAGLADAPDDVLELYLAQCRALGVDPLSRMIYVIPRRVNIPPDDRHPQWRSELRWTFQASIDLFRSIAEESGDYAGQLGPQWSNDGVTWADVWLGKEPPAVCKIGILRKSFSEPLWVTGTYEYYVPRDAKGNPAPTNFWKGEKGAHQLAKCVEELALRKAFPRKLRGIYGDDEMRQAPRPAALPKQTGAIKDEIADAQFEALPAGNVTPFRPVESRSTMPVEYRRKKAFGEIQKLQDLRYPQDEDDPAYEPGEKRPVIPDQEYRELLIAVFGTERFADKETGEVKPTKSALPIEDLERLWLILRDLVKKRAPELL